MTWMRRRRLALRVDARKRAIGLVAFLGLCLAAASPARAGDVAPAAHPAYLLIHGWAGDRATWDPVRLELGPSAHAIDLPGHGGDRTDVSGWTMARFVEALERRRRDVGARCLVLVAHSNGAYLARQFWRRHPDRVAAIVIVEGTFVPPFRDVEGMRAASERVGRSWSAYLGSPPGLENAKPETVRAVRSMVERASLRSALATLGILVEEEVTRLDPMTVPVIFALAQSPHWTPEHRARLQRIAPGATFVELGALSHYAPLDDPTLVAGVIRQAAQGRRCKGETGDPNRASRDRR